MRVAGHVVDPRLRRDGVAEVEWYFQCAEAEMCAPSNFGRVLASVGPDGSRRTSEDQADAARAHRHIRRRLYAMPNNEAGVLQVAYEPRHWPRAVRARFGDLGGIAVRMMSALDDWPEDRSLQALMDEARARDLNVRCGRPAKEGTFLERLKLQAQARLDTALVAYLEVRGTGPSVIPPRAWGRAT
jgi:hypothetical protein